MLWSKISRGGVPAKKCDRADSTPLPMGPYTFRVNRRTYTYIQSLLMVQLKISNSSTFCTETYREIVDKISNTEVLLAKKDIFKSEISNNY